MKSELKKISEIVAQANDLFYEKNKNISTSIGIMDKVLRKQGMAADAVTIEAISFNQKIVLLMHDQRQNIVEVAIGNSAGDIETSTDYPIENITTTKIVELMTTYFT